MSFRFFFRSRKKEIPSPQTEEEHSQNSPNVGTLCQRILRPGEETLQTAFTAWKVEVHADEEERMFYRSGTVQQPVVKERKKLFPIHPHGAPRIVLDLLGLLVIAYDMIAIPLYLAFSTPPGYVIKAVYSTQGRQAKR